MFFLPMAATGVTLAGTLDVELTRALVRFREERAAAAHAVPDSVAERQVAGSRRATLVGVFWGLAWVALAAAWVVFLAQILQLRPDSAGLYVLALGAAGPAVPIGRLAARCARKFPLGRFTTRAALGAAVLGGVAVPLLLSERLLEGSFLVIAGWVFCGSLGLALAAIGLRVGWPRLRLGFCGLVYIILGLLFLLPVPPISRQSYNPVGAFFPWWGLGAPAVTIIWGFSRFLKTRGMDGDTPGSNAPGGDDPGGGTSGGNAPDGRR